jgi:hypothetical protein
MAMLIESLEITVVTLGLAWWICWICWTRAI